MSDPPAKKFKDSSSITMLLDKTDLVLGKVQHSIIHRLFGLPWHLEAEMNNRSSVTVSLHCDAASESELWRANATLRMKTKDDDGSGNIKYTRVHRKSHSFLSWKPASHKCELTRLDVKFDEMTEVIVDIKLSEAESFARRLPIDGPAPDVILVLEGQKFPENKQELASQSSYFNGLLCGNFKESKQEEVEIKNTNPKDFSECLKMLRGVSNEHLSIHNVTRFLKMADLFDLQIVKDRMENFLISSNISNQSRVTRMAQDFSYYRKLKFAKKYKLEIFKSELEREETKKIMQAFESFYIDDSFPRNLLISLLNMRAEIKD